MGIMARGLAPSCWRQGVSATLGVMPDRTSPRPTAESRTARIAALNDALRTEGIGGRIMITSGLQALESDDLTAIIAAVRGFSDFTPDNDPHGEHDCAVLEVAGHRIIWKIDTYDPTMTFAAEDPTDPEATVRVLTIMLAEEY
jgi:hypothetical protein